DHEGNRVIERIERPRAERHERLPEQRELDDLDRASRTARRVGGQRGHAVDLRVRDHRSVEGGGLLGFLAVPQMRNDPGQCCLHKADDGVTTLYPLLPAAQSTPTTAPPNGPATL